MSEIPPTLAAAVEKFDQAAATLAAARAALEEARAGISAAERETGVTHYGRIVRGGCFL